MATAKIKSYSDSTVQLARWAKALSHPARIAILQILQERQACICGDLVDVLPLSQATVSQHLKELKNAGLIKGNIDGPRICYCIDEEVWEEAGKLVAQLFSSPMNIPKCC